MWRTSESRRKPLLAPSLEVASTSDVALTPITFDFNGWTSTHDTCIRAAITACSRTKWSECFVVPFKKVTYTIVSLISSSPSAVVEWSALFPHIWKVPRSNVGPKTAYPDVLRCFPQSLQANSGTVVAILGGRDGVVDMAVRNGMDGQGIGSPWGRDFPCRPDSPRGPPSLLYNGYHILPRRGADHPTPSGAEVTNEMELYHRLPSVPT